MLNKPEFKWIGRILSYSHNTEVRIASSVSGRFITAIVVNPPKRRPAKRTSVHWSITF